MQIIFKFTLFYKAKIKLLEIDFINNELNFINDI